MLATEPQPLEVHEAIAPTLGPAKVLRVVKRERLRDGTEVERPQGFRAFNPPSTVETYCARWPKAMRLASASGRMVKGRCRGTNVCAYCRRMYTVETVEALLLDAMSGDAPTLWIVLTAREHLTRPQFNEALRIVRKRLKRHGWEWEYFSQVEFQKRGALHVNLLVKLRGGDELLLMQELKDAWCDQVDAELPGQWSSVILQELGGAETVAGYISKELAHGMKQEQAPPLGWSGHRTSHSRGYFGRPMWQVRAEARASLNHGREVHKAELQGYEPIEAEAIADAAIARSEGERWELVVLTPDENGELQRVRPAAGGGVEVVRRSDDAKRRRFRQEQNAGRALRALDDAAGLALAVTGRDPVPQTPPAALFTLTAERERF